jgi:hypothetical protein
MSILHGIVGIGAALVVGFKSCGDDILKGASRSVDDIPAKHISPYIDETPAKHVSELPDNHVLYSKNIDNSSPSSSTRLTFDNILIKPELPDIEEHLYPGERIFYNNLDSVGKLEIDTQWFEVVKKPRIISFFPSNKIQYKNVYGMLPSISAVQKMNGFQQKLIQETSLLKYSSDKTDDVFRNIEETDGNPLVILAHSEDGGKLVVFPDGSKMNINDIHAKCIEILKRCMVLTCKGDDFELDENISAMDALNIWSSINKKVNENKIAKVNELVSEARNIRKNQKTKEKILISWTASTAIGVPYLKVSMQDEKGGTHRDDGKSISKSKN